MMKDWLDASLFYVSNEPNTDFHTYADPCASTNLHRCENLYLAHCMHKKRTTRNM